MRMRQMLAVLLLVGAVTLGTAGCASDPEKPLKEKTVTETETRSEDDNATLDALLDKDPSAMPDALMSSGGWTGRLEYAGKDYRVFELTVDGKKARLYYLPAETAGEGLTLAMYDVEPFQIEE